MDRSYLAINIKYLRKKMRMTPDEIANVIDVPEARYIGWENGTSEPTNRQLIYLSKAYALSVDDLLKVNLKTSVGN